MRLAAVADIHLKAENHERDIKEFSAVNELADALVIAGDLTNHGNPEEMKVVLGVLQHIRVPIIAVLGNHDHESGHQDEIAGMLRVAGCRPCGRPGSAVRSDVPRAAPAGTRSPGPRHCAAPS